MTKLATIATVLLAASSATAFSASRPLIQTAQSSSTSLNLFGSKPKDESADAAKQPGMMDQLAMFKKAQELSQMKNDIDKELAEEKITGSAADGNIEITVKYVPPQMPTNPSPGYEASDVTINEEYLASVSAEDLSSDLVEAIRAGEKSAMDLVGEKYKALEGQMKEIMGQ